MKTKIGFNDLGVGELREAFMRLSFISPTSS